MHQSSINGGSLTDGSTERSYKMTPGNDLQRWYALQVRTRWEGSTALLLSGKGYETLLPTYKAKKRWSGKPKEFNVPLFPGYVFCRFDAQKRLPVLVTPGVISVVACSKVPLPVDEGEIAALQTVVATGLLAEPWPYLELGQKVRIESEPLRGLEGILISFKGNHRIVLSVSLLRRSVALEVDQSSVRPVNANRGNFLEPVQPLLQGVVV